MEQTSRMYYRNRLTVFMLLLFAAATFWWVFTASYLGLYVPVASYHGDIWCDTHRTTLTYADEPGVLYVIRRSGTAYGEIQGWNNAADATAFFDKWLTERGWVRAHIYPHGDPAVPESQFLEF